MKWKLEKLVDVCDFQGGTQPPKSEWLNEKRDGYIRMVQIRDFTQGKESFVEYVKDSKKLKKCSADDIMIGRYGASIGKILTGLDGAYNVALVKTIPSNKLDRNYFYHYLNASYFQNFIQNAGSRAAQAGFNKEELKELQIPLPPLPTQQKIAAILDEADALRRKDKALLAKYDELLQAVFYDMFGDPVKNEKGWEVKKLGGFSDVQGGLQLFGDREKYSCKAPYLRVANVYRNGLNLSEIKQIGLTEKEFEKTKLQKDDILIVEGHGNKNEIGRCAIWDGSIENCVHQNHLIRLRVDQDKISVNYLSFYINSEGGKKQMFDTSNTTSGLNTISTGKVKAMNILVPPVEFQMKFQKIMSNIEHQKSQIIQQQTHSENLFQSLMQRAFKGELVG